MTHPLEPLMRREGEIDRRPWGLIIALSTALMVGAVGLPLQVITFSRLGEASKAEQLTRGQQALCRQMNEIAVQAHLQPSDCAELGKAK